MSARIKINHPDEMVVVGRSVWVKTDDGFVVQVDAGTGKALGRVRADSTDDGRHYCQGMGTDGTAVWACSAAGSGPDRRIDVVRIDPATRRVTRTLAVGKIFDQFEMPVVAGHLWVLAGGGKSLVGVNLADERMRDPIELPAPCLQLAGGGDTLVAACRDDRLVLRIDPATGSVLWRAPLDRQPKNVFLAGNAVWVLQDAEIVRLDPATGKPLTRMTGLPGAGDGDVVVEGDDVWLRRAGGAIDRLHAQTGASLTRLDPAEPLAPGSLVLTQDSFWVSDSDAGIVFRLRR